MDSLSESQTEPAMDLQDIKNLHIWYILQLKELMGDSFKRDMSMRPEGVFEIWKLLEHKRPRLILELGAGFTTLFTQQWAAENDAELMVAEHSEEWISLIEKILKREGGKPKANFITVEDLKKRSLKMSSPRFDFCIVDHGPSWDDRYGDLPWILSLLSDEGTLILDDWWPTICSKPRFSRSVKIASNILRRMGLEATPIEESRPNRFDKAISIVRRMEKRPDLSK